MNLPLARANYVAALKLTLHFAENDNDNFIEQHKEDIDRMYEQYKKVVENGNDEN